MEPASLDRQIAARVSQLRGQRAMSLAALAELSGVSRSMISLIERAETSATAVVLEKLAGALDISLAALFEPTSSAASPLSRRKDQHVWRDPGSGYLRRNVSPGGVDSPIQIVEIVFPPGARVAYDSPPRQTPAHHQVWVLQGSIDLALGDEHHQLAAGDCLAFVLDRPTTYHNTTQRPARYVVVVSRSKQPS